ncbi:MAG: hypothetical protein AAB554_01015 [Patescibacteria group bacterium]
MRRWLFIVCALAVIGFFAPKPFSVASAGDLIRTSSDPAVYYLGTDGMRYVFTGTSVFFSWYEGFGTVRTISASEMSSRRIGGNVTYRPGTRLVKIDTDPKTYAVARGGVLRHVASEGIADCLYGSAWRGAVEDVPVESFTNYRLGDPIIACDGFDPSAEKASAPTISEDRRLGAAPAVLPSTPTFSLAPVSTIATAGKEAALMELLLATSVPLEIRRLPVKLTALSGIADRDLGGLVRGDSVRANLTRIRFVDAGGASVFGTLDVSLSTSDDQEYVLEFAGGLRVPAGETRLRLTATFDEETPIAEPYRAIAVTSRAEVFGADGRPAAFLPKTDLAGGIVQVRKDALEIAAAEFHGPKTQVRGAQSVELAAFTFNAAALTQTLRAIAFQGYLDEQEGGAGYLAGGDADNGTETRVRDIVGAVSLHDQSGARVAGPVEVPYDGRVRFEGLALVLPAGSAGVYALRGDLDRDAQIEARPDIVAFDVVDAAKDVVIVDASGDAVEAYGTAPNGGTRPVYALTVRQHGTLALDFAGSSAKAVVGRPVELGNIVAAASYDDFTITSLTFPFTGVDRAPIGALRLFYIDAKGANVSVTGEFVGGDAFFKGLAIHVPKDKKAYISFQADVVESYASVSGARLRFRFAADRNFGFASVTEGRDFSGTDLAAGHGFAVTSNVAADLQLRLTELSASRAYATPSGPIARGASEEVLRFTLTAGPEGRARVKRMVFRIKAGDAGTDGADNDALERWADIDGDVIDDNDVIDLRKISVSGAEVIGEGSDASIRYGMYTQSGKDSTPQGRDSATVDAGYVEIDFASGSELAIEAGETATFALGLRTSAFPVGQRSLGVELFGAEEFLWMDSDSGNAAPLDGREVRGLPVVAPGMIIQ